MALVEDVKNAIEAAAGLGTPSSEELKRLVRPHKPKTLRFKDDGFIPNHPNWPLLLYQACIRLPKNRDPAAIFETLFAQNGWTGLWRDGIYDFVHYHSRTHEVVAVARGRARVQFGGPKGKIVHVKAGDAAVLPAGTGHQCLHASPDFLTVGAYPPAGTYDECKNVEQHKRAKASIPKTPRPHNDPIHGPDGPLLQLWRTKGRSP